MRTGVALTVLVVLCYPVAALAQDVARPFNDNPITDLVVPDVEPEDRAALAEALAAEGDASFERGDHATAARQLEVSYRLAPDAERLLNLGLSLLELGYYRAAAERLERYLEESVTTVAERRERAEAALDQARQHIAAVRVETEPTGARLLLDGQTVGTTPLADDLVLDAGDYRLVAQLDGHRDAEEALHVEGGAPMDLLLHLEPLRRAPSGLSVGLWTSLGLSLACAAVLVPSIVFAFQRTDELRTEQFPSSGMRTSAITWRATSYAMAGATGAATVSTVVFAVLRSMTGENRGAQ